MAFDRISEEIAHFIGLFHLEIEGQRLRLDYDAFSIQRSDEARLFPDPPELKIAAPFALKGFTPGLVHLPPFHDPFLPALPPGNIVFASVTVDGIPPPPSLPALDLPLAPSGAQMGGLFVPLPNSILVAIRQSADLSDNDLLVVTGETAFVDPAQLTADLHGLIATAQSLEAPALADGGSLPRLEAMTDLAGRIAAFAPAEDGPAEIQLVLRGEGLQGTWLDGVAPLPATEAEPDGAPGGADPDLPEAADAPAAPPDLPEFDDLLPAYLAAKRADPEEAEEPPGTDPFTQPRDPAIAPGPDLPALDLPALDPGHKIVTGGNVAINEVVIHKAWVDAPVIAVAGDAIRLDTVSQLNLRKDAPSALPGAEMLPSTALNAVRLETESAPDPAQATGGGSPQAFSTVRVEGDLVAVNWVQQHVFATDFDRAEIVVTAAATYISTGGNVITNAVWLKEFGFTYDLILVGGDMITLNQIDQVNVLVDVDVIGGLAGADAAVSAGDNLQVNLAEIRQTGRDEMVAMTSGFQKALDDMAEGKRGVSQEVLQDARFAGKSALKVLQVEGDLIKANIIAQKNYLGDSDQLQLMLEGLLAAGDGIELITGSNAQLNAARLHDVGVDSAVLVAGTAYSDALIYQAQLLDPEAPPTGVALAPLASEAVAFLAEDMIGAARDIEPGATTAAADHPANSDALHAILT